MNREQLIEKIKANEVHYWKYTEFIRHNPVLYPRVGDIFLKEIFALANPDYEVPYSRRKKVQMDTVWYGVSDDTLALFLVGCEMAGEFAEDLDVYLDNGNLVPFYVYWYLACLFLDEAKKMCETKVPQESIARLKKDKSQKGICKPDSRKYYKCIGYFPKQVASDVPVTKNFCPVEKEYLCERKCPGALTIGQTILSKGTFGFRQKEELLHLYLLKTGRLPAGILAGELLFDFMVKEYAYFCELMEEQATHAALKRPVNCQLFNLFAYIVDALCTADWLEMKESENLEALREELENNNLWQLYELLANKKKITPYENPLGQILHKARKTVSESKKDLTIMP